jgi:hypothetical protein
MVDSKALRPQKVFKAGTWTSDTGKAHTYSDEQVIDIANSYDPALKPANFVEGHPDDDSPGYGTVSAAYVDPDSGWLVVVPKGVPESFTSRVNAGEFNGWSASFLPPGHPDNPRGDKGHYLKHVGAVPKGFDPGVSGQPVQQFCSSNDTGVINFYYMAEKPDDKPTTPPAATPIVPNEPGEVHRVQAEQFAKLQEDIKTAQEQLATQQKEIAEQKAVMIKEGAQMKAESFVNLHRTKLQGDEIAGVKAALTALYIQDATTPVSFTNGDKTVNVSTAYEDAIKNRPSIVPDGSLDVESFVEAQKTQASAILELNKAHGKNLIGAQQ